jgi:hypothetical protein
MRPVRTLLIAASAAVVVAVTGAWGFPRPALVPYRWELLFEPGELRLYQDSTGGGSYWYLPYKVTNRTGRQQVWAPAFTLYTDGGEILPSGRDVPLRVTDEIIALLGNPLLETQNEVIGEIEHGRENAREAWRSGRPGTTRSTRCRSSSRA